MDLLSLNFQYAKFVQLIAESGGEITDQQETELIELENALLKKADSIHYVLMMLEAQAKMFSEEAERMKTMQKMCERGQERLKKNIQVFLENTNQDTLEGERVAFYLRNNPGLVEILNENEIPKEFKVTTVIEKVDKKKIAQIIKNGGEVHGARLVKSRSVAIKTPKGRL